MITAIYDRLALTVGEFKTHMRIDHADEDTLLESILDAAKLQADHFCQNNFTRTNEDGAIVTDPIPLDIKMAVMKIAASLYENRTDHISGENVAGLSYNTGITNWNARQLLFPYRKFFAV